MEMFVFIIGWLIFGIATNALGHYLCWHRNRDYFTWAGCNSWQHLCLFYTPHYAHIIILVFPPLVLVSPLAYGSPAKHDEVYQEWLKKVNEAPVETSVED